MNLRYVFDAAVEGGAYCAFISGAGSTLVAITHISQSDKVAREFEKAFDEAADDWEVDRILTLDPTNEGAGLPEPPGRGVGAAQ